MSKISLNTICFGKRWESNVKDFCVGESFYGTDLEKLKAKVESAFKEKRLTDEMQDVETVLVRVDVYSDLDEVESKTSFYSLGEECDESLKSDMIRYLDYAD